MEVIMDNFNGKRLLNVKELCQYVGLGKNKAVEWAKGIGAARHMGRRVFFDRVVLDKALDGMTDKDNGLRLVEKE